MCCAGGAGVPDVLAGVGGPCWRGHWRRDDLCALAARADACHEDTGMLYIPNTYQQLEALQQQGPLPIYALALGMTCALRVSHAQRANASAYADSCIVLKADCKLEAF